MQKIIDRIFFILSSKSKKCAAKAAHEKRILRLLRHNFRTLKMDAEKRCIFTETKIHLIGLNYSVVSQEYSTMYE